MSNQPVKVIGRHPGNVEEWEYGECTYYIPINGDKSAMISGTIPETPDYCIHGRGFRFCDDCEDQAMGGTCGVVVDMPREVVDREVDEWIKSGYPYVESDGMLIIDITGHDPAICDEHPQSGCIQCFGCKEQHFED